MAAEFTGPGPTIRRWAWTAAVAVSGASGLGQATPDRSLAELGSIEREVRDNVLRQSIGPLTVETLALPDEFLRRIVDRVIRVSYQDRYHVVARDPASDSATEESPDAAKSEPQPNVGSTPGKTRIDVVRHDVGSDVSRYRMLLPAHRPYLRGFRAPILTNANERFPVDGPIANASPAIHRVTDLVARRLAYDGLLPTLVRVVEMLRGETLLSDEAALEHRLRSVGFPVDVLRHFEIRSSGSAESVSPLRVVVRSLARGDGAAGLESALRKARFRWQASAAGFQLATECGEHDVARVRLQLTRGDYWVGVGAGGNLDVARQLVERFPEAAFTMAIEEKHLASFLRLSKSWQRDGGGRLSVHPTPLPVAQWAQDNGKAGIIELAAAGPRVITLVPRYASRRDDGSTFIPNESFVMDGLAAAGNDVVQSPLLFQGGNVMAVRSPRDNTRTLLIGEAEIYRNVALGLTAEQVSEGFRVEFGVDRVLVLPAVSFHIDFELTVRARGDRWVVCVNDSAAAVRVILNCGVGALERAGVLDVASAGDARRLLGEGKALDFVTLVGGVVRGRMTPSGQYPLSFAQAFQDGPSDSGVGNLQRFLLAIDLLVSWNIGPRQLPPDPHARAYIASIQRRESDRAELRTRLRALGFEVVGVPSLAEGERGVNYVNGIHDRTRYLMPAYGGLFAPLDAAAATAFGRAFGTGVRIVPILSGESQRRGGAVHCAACVYPDVGGLGGDARRGCRRCRSRLARVHLTQSTKKTPPSFRRRSRRRGRLNSGSIS